jgi:hypothetical protein
MNNDGLYLVKGCVLPRNWERALGYPGDARWMAAYWTPGDGEDEAVYADGLMTGSANFGPYLSLTRQCKLEITLALQEIRACSTANALSAIHLLGSPENDASYHLVLDLMERKICVAPKRASTEFLKQQHPQKDYPPLLSFIAEEVNAWMASLPKNFKSTKAKIRLDFCTCHHGWVVSDDGGFDPCPRNCDRGIVWNDKQWTTSQ